MASFDSHHAAMGDFMPDSFDTLAPASSALPVGPLLVPHYVLDQGNYDAEGHSGNETQLSTMHRFNSGYDDSYSDSLSSFEPAFQGEPPIPESPSIEKGHKILQFSSPPSLSCPMLDFISRPTLLSLTAQLHGMFFLADSAFPVAKESVASAKDLTCYRRNLFQVTGSLSMSTGVRYVAVDGRQLPIAALEATISATETVDRNPVKLICVPWKSPGAGTSAADEKVEREPGPIAIDLSSGEDVDADFVNVPIAWKRLQFRIATANNGRRKELQQHFLLYIKLVATLADGSRVDTAEIRSNAIVVRGRSPRNFQSRNDLPISSSVGRRSHHVSRHSTGDARLPSSRHANRMDRPAQLDLPKVSFSFEMGNLTPSPSFSDWKMPLTQPGMDSVTSVPTDYPMITVPTPPEEIFAFSHASPTLGHLTAPMRPASAPLHPPVRRPLSGVGSPLNGHAVPRSIPAPTSRPRSPYDAPEGPPAGMSPKKRARTGETPPPVMLSDPIAAPHPQNIVSGPIPFMVEGYVDPLYENFPYGMGDWHPTVDPMYYSPPVSHVNPEFIPTTGPGKRQFTEEAH